jgi:hypothetical protein
MSSQTKVTGAAFSRFVVRVPSTGFKQTFQLTGIGPAGFEADCACPTCEKISRVTLPFVFRDSRMSIWASPNEGAKWLPSYGVASAEGGKQVESWLLSRAEGENVFSGIHCGGVHCAAGDPLAKAIQTLDAEVDSEWTGDGLPALPALKKQFPTVTREQVSAALPGWTRKTAKTAVGL